MRRDFGVRGFYKRYFDPDLPLKAQIFHLLAFTGIIAGLFCTVAGFFLNDSIIDTLATLFIAVLAFLLLRLAERFDRYHLCSWVTVVVVFLVMFPMLYFIYGGYKTGASMGLFVALTFTALLLDGYERIAALAVEYVLYVAVILADFYNPEYALVLQVKFNNEFLMLASFTLVSVLLLIVLSIRSKLYSLKQGQIEELNRELTDRNKSLAQFDQMKSDFLATVAHEINTPLAVIAASSNDTLDLLNEAPLNLEEMIENQVVIDRRVKLIDSILLDLMDTVAIETGRLSLNRQPVYLPDLLKNICDAQFKRLDVNNNKISYDFLQGTPEVWADPQRIEQVMTNLLSNACLHTKNGHISVKLTRTGQNQIASVIDDGEGMEAETARVVLRQYVSSKADYWRHGIGLAICRRIIAAHGGQIWVESEKGRGTTISFSLREEAGYE